MPAETKRGLSDDDTILLELGYSLLGGIEDRIESFVFGIKRELQGHEADVHAVHAIDLCNGILHFRCTVCAFQVFHLEYFAHIRILSSVS